MKLAPVSFALVILGLSALPLPADWNNELAFTAFGNADFSTLGHGQVLQAKGGLIEFERGLTTQSLYVIDSSPATVAAKLVSWNPASHPELEVWAHRSLPPKASPADVAAAMQFPDNSSINKSISATKNGDSSLQLNASETALLQSLRGQGDDHALYTNFWSQVISGRLQRFSAGGLAGDDYNVGGGKVEPQSDILRLLRSDSKIYAAFHPVLATTPIFKGTGTPAICYLDCFDVEGTAALGTGAVYQLTTGPSIESADIEYYVNSGIYVSIELERLWPVTIDGREQTLVWRDDLISTNSIEVLHGTERLASGMIMLQDIKQAIQAFRSEFK